MFRHGSQTMAWKFKNITSKLHWQRKTGKWMTAQKKKQQQQQSYKQHFNSIPEENRRTSNSIKLNLFECILKLFDSNVLSKGHKEKKKESLNKLLWQNMRDRDGKDTSTFI